MNNIIIMEKLIDSLKALPMTMEDKKKFVSEISNIGTSKYAPRYFTIDWTKCNENWKYLLTDAIVDSYDPVLITTIGSSYKTFGAYLNHYMITAYPFLVTDQDGLYSFSYIPLYIPEEVLTNYGIEHKPGFQSFEDVINLINLLSNRMLEQEFNLSMEGITEITEEEFYNVD